VRSECSPSDGLMVAQDAEVHVIRLDPTSGCVAYQFEPGHGGYVYVIEGDLAVNLERLGTQDAARVVGAGRLHIQASNATELLIVDVVA